VRRSGSVRGPLASQMHLCVTFSTQGDEVLLRVAPRMASELDMVNFQALHTPTHLAPPAVPLKDLAMQFTISLDVKFDPWLLKAGLVHEALPLTSDKKTPC
jgi:hypothetical protein